MPQFGRLAGTASFFIDESPYPTASDLEYQTSSSKREPLYDLDTSYQGFSETGEAPYIKITLRATGGYVPGDLFDMVGVQVSAVLANGNTVSGYSMTMMEPPVVKNADATFEVKFIGPSVTEQPS